MNQLQENQADQRKKLHRLYFLTSVPVMFSVEKIMGKTRVTSVYRFLKSPFRVFRPHKKYAEYPDARGAKVVIPTTGLFGRSRPVPSSGTKDSQLAMMRNAPKPRITRQPIIQFPTVESTVSLISS